MSDMKMQEHLELLEKQWNNLITWKRNAKTLLNMAETALAYPAVNKGTRTAMAKAIKSFLERGKL